MQNELLFCLPVNDVHLVSYHGNTKSVVLVPRIKIRYHKMLLTFGIEGKKQTSYPIYSNQERIVEKNISERRDSIGSVERDEALS